MKIKKNIVVVGNGMVGYKFCARLIEKDKNKQYKIVTFSEEPRPAYDRVHLTDFFNGISADDLSLAGVDWYKDKGIDLHLGDKVEAINTREKVVISSKGLTIPYDKLVFATGSSAFVPPIEGIEKEGVFV